jgi:hypothetical protein
MGRQRERRPLGKGAASTLTIDTTSNFDGSAVDDLVGDSRLRAGVGVVCRRGGDGGAER